MHIIGSILKQANRKNSDKLNILTGPTHERYESNLTKTGHNFYALSHPSFKKWNTNFAPVPENYTILDESKGDKQIPLSVDFDIVLSQNKFGQYQILSQIARHYNIPFISLEHTLPMSIWSQEQKEGLRNMRGDVNLFISEYSKGEWGFNDVPNTEVIHHGIDTDIFKPDYSVEKERRILSVCNDWINRDFFCGFSIWQRVTNGLPVFPVGDTVGLSKPAKDIDELVYFYRKHQIFLNTSTVSPIPTSLLEAMSCGSCVISTATCMIPEIIKNGYNGFISNNEEELRGFLIDCLSNSEKCKRIGENARKTIVDNFSLSSHLNKWTEIFDKVSKTNTNRRTW